MVDSAGPSTPIQILGMNGVVKPGDTINVVANEREAKRVAEHRIDERKALENAGAKKLSLEDFFAADNNSEGGKKFFNLLFALMFKDHLKRLKLRLKFLEIVK
jgi:translation initiation factor IF-2